jgi:hypothetical protein
LSLTVEEASLLLSRPLTWSISVFVLRWPLFVVTPEFLPAFISWEWPLGDCEARLTALSPVPVIVVVVVVVVVVGASFLIRLTSFSNLPEESVADEDAGEVVLESVG